MRKEMKRSIIYLAAAVFAVAACSKELPEINDESQGVTVTLTASIDQTTKAMVEDPDGKSAGDLLSTTWNSGDVIAVYTKLGNRVEFSTTDSGATANFTGTLAAGDEIDDSSVAIYPAAIAGGDATQVTMPSSYASAEAAKKGIALYGTVSGTSISFSHMGAMLGFQIKEIPTAATTATLTATGCAGTFAVSGGLIEKSSESATIVITLSDVDKSSAVLAFPVPVGTYDGFSLAFNDGSSVAKTTTKSITMSQSHYKMMASFTVSGAEQTLGIVGEFQGWDPASRVRLTAVPGYNNWFVAKGINLIGGTGDNSGFKFCEGDSWTDNNFGASESGAQNLYTFINTGGYNVKVENSGSYDIYINPDSTNGRIIILPAGTPIVKTIYVLSEYMPGKDFGSDPCLHIWGAEGQGNVTNWDENVFILQNGTTTINGISFQTFPVHLLNNYTCNSGAGHSSFWKGGKYRMQYYKQPQGERVFELREDKGTERGTHVMVTTVQGASFFVRAGLNIPDINAFSSAYGIPSMMNISGTFNGWPGAADGLHGVWINNGILWESVPFSSGANEWKIRNYPNWDHQNICVSANEVVIVGEELQLMHGGSQNLSCTVSEAGNYDIFLDMTNLKMLVTKSK